MPNIQEIMQQIQKDLYCPVCGKQYDVNQIKIRGIHDNTITFQTTCSNGHATIFMTTFQKKEEHKEPVTIDEVLDITNFLKSFNGDFEAVLK